MIFIASYKHDLIAIQTISSLYETALKKNQPNNKIFDVKENSQHQKFSKCSLKDFYYMLCFCLWQTFEFLSIENWNYFFNVQQ